MHLWLGDRYIAVVLVSLIGCSSSSTGPALTDAQLEASFEEGVKVLRIDHNMANIAETVYMFRYYMSVPTVSVPVVNNGNRMKQYLCIKAMSDDAKTFVLAKALIRIIDCPERVIDGTQESGTISVNGKPYRAQFTAYALNYLKDNIQQPLPR